VELVVQVALALLQELLEQVVEEQVLLEVVLLVEMVELI
jgi:hypothetical protein